MIEVRVEKEEVGSMVGKEKERLSVEMEQSL